MDAAAYGRFLPAWQNVRVPGRRGQSALRGLDGIITAVDQLSGVPIPASAWEPLVLAGRVSDYQPAMLDELMAAGEVLWSGAGALPGNDGWVSLHLADSAELTLNPALDFEPGDAQQRLLDHLRNNGGGYFFRQLTEVAGGMDSVLSDQDVVSALWDLAWAGRITGDTFAPVRAMIAGGHTAHRQVARAPRARAPRTEPAGTRPRHRTAGVPRADRRPVRLRHRHGSHSPAGRGPLVRPARTRTGSPPSTPGPPRNSCWTGTAWSPAVRSWPRTSWAVSASCTRSWPGWRKPAGAAAATSSSTLARHSSPCPRRWTGCARTPRTPQLHKPEPVALALAATDPANPYGAALPWPALNVDAGTGHRPGRKAGALVVLVDGALVLYVERGGKTLLAFSEDTDVLAAAGAALVGVVTRGAVDKLIMEKVNGHGILDTPVAAALAHAGAYSTPKGLRIRA